jgi:hypothetical protein
MAGWRSPNDPRPTLRPCSRGIVRPKPGTPGRSRSCSGGLPGSRRWTSAEMIASIARSSMPMSWSWNGSHRPTAHRGRRPGGATRRISDEHLSQPSDLEDSMPTPSYTQLCAQYQTPPPAPANPAEEPCVFGPIVQVYTEPYPTWLRDAWAQYTHVRQTCPQLLQGFLLSLWWERGRHIPTCRSPGRYR